MGWSKKMKEREKWDGGERRGERNGIQEKEGERERETGWTRKKEREMWDGGERRRERNVIERRGERNGMEEKEGEREMGWRRKMGREQGREKWDGIKKGEREMRWRRKKGRKIFKVCYIFLWCIDKHGVLLTA